jgi:peptide/nickel transport system substrate-binding protein
VVESVWFDDIANGHFDLAIGAVVSTLLDPSDYFDVWYRTVARRTTRPIAVG